MRGNSTMTTLRTYLKLLKLLQRRRNGISPTETAKELGMNIRTLYRYLTVLGEMESLYTERRDGYVYYKLLRGDE